MTPELLRRTTHMLLCGAVAFGAAIGAAFGCDGNATHPGLQAYAPRPGTPLVACLPDGDGAITAAELKPLPGIPAHFRIGMDRAVDLQGQVFADGSRRWDWRGGGASDQQFDVAAAKLAGKWYAGKFAGGHFTLPFDAAGTVEAVYAHNAEALWLLGMASTDPAPKAGQTLLVYTLPVALFRFPLAVGRAWTAVGEVKQGVLRGLPYAGKDTYEVAVDAAGTLLLPDVAAERVLRVRTKVTAAPIIGGAIVQHQVSLVFECLGEVARAVGPLGHDVADFTTAAEVRRLRL